MYITPMTINKSPQPKGLKMTDAPKVTLTADSTDKPVQPVTDKRDTVIKDTVSPPKAQNKGPFDAKYVTSTAIGNVCYPTYALLDQTDMDCTKLVVGDKVSLKTADLTLTGEFVKLAGVPLVNIVLDKVQAKANAKPLNKGL